MTYDLEPPLPRTATPKDYHRVHFDPSALPDKRIVGLLACQRDPLLRALTTRILSANPAPISAPPPAKGRAKQKKPNGDASATASGSATPSGSDAPKLEVKGQLWEVELEDTIIFPEGGGQPFDTGRLVVEVEGAREEFVVEGCLRKKLESVHLVRVPEGKESVLQAAVGGIGEVTVDWERRMDHMALHTGQHLLSALLDVHAEGLPTLSWSMAPYPSLDLPYVELPRGLTWAEAEEIERKCNEAIYEATKVWVDVTMQEEGFVKETAAGVRENRGIPSDYKDGVIRHIIIQGIDKNACCGTQLPHLGHLGFLHVLPPSTPSTSTKPAQTPSRLYFVAGPRAVQYLQHSSRQLSLAAQAIAVNRGEIVPRVEKLDQGRKELLAREKTLRTELAQVIGENAVPDAQGAALVKRTEKSTHDFEFMGAISFAVKDAKVVVVVSAPAGVDPALVLVQSADADLAKKTNEGIKEGLVALAGGEKGKYKGGGAKGRYMGKVEGKWGKAEDEVVKRVLAGQ